ncbi:MarR family winged helix-turn-helix transcriptional regulator [Ferrimonas balearica]|uniref:MarR family winged helix-turn-helix transcriptional regulator n=1 Tax=Ferrimonas balearica TaxID=44012 RepID=UPI001F3DE3EA|nr:MarR family transcriptional regulator [Ferrimonas balearica]MBY6017558.1 MarR family transcriptional regulator [Halomonas denitrificans]MBY6093897.1 MarR family transcriptional regulator [Ferrimonas balearica]
MSASHSPLQLQRFIPYRLADLAHRLSQELSAIYAEPPFAISIAEWRVLAQLAEHPALTSKTLGRLTGMDKTKVSRAVQRLAERNLLVQQRDENDQRQRYLRLSESGQALYQQLAPHALDWERRRLAALDPQERQQLLALLDKLDQAEPRN